MIQKIQVNLTPIPGKVTEQIILETTLRDRGQGQYKFMIGRSCLANLTTFYNTLFSVTVDDIYPYFSKTPNSLPKQLTK